MVKDNITNVIRSNITTASLFIFTNVETAEFMFSFELRHILADVFFVIHCKINIVLFANQKRMR